MPELPEVETARRQVDEKILGRRIEKVFAADDSIVFSGVNPRTFSRSLRGRKVVSTHRRGKHIWFAMDEGPAPMFHFGMTGNFHLYPSPSERPRFCKVELQFEGGLCLAMTNSRRLGRIRLSPSPEEEPFIVGLGFDPLVDLPPVSDFEAALARRKVAIKSLLLNQSFAAGVGNWIADEVLYQSKIAPMRSARDLSGVEAKVLRKNLRSIVRKAVEVGAESSRFPRSWLFHCRWGREDGAETSRREKVAFETIGGRTAAWVPEVQR